MSCLISAMTTPGIVSCTLFLDPAYQRNRNGLLLQGALFIYRRLREWFLPHLFAELRGCSDEQGQFGMRWAIISSTSRSPMPTG